MYFKINYIFTYNYLIMNRNSTLLKDAWHFNRYKLKTDPVRAWISKGASNNDSVGIIVQWDSPKHKIQMHKVPLD